MTMKQSNKQHVRRTSTAPQSPKREKRQGTRKKTVTPQARKPQVTPLQVAHTLIAGKNPVIEAMQSGRKVYQVWIGEHSQKGQMQTVQSLAQENEVPIQPIKKQQLDEWIGHSNHQGVVAAVKPYDYATIDMLFDRAQAANEAPFFLLLDGIEDPHNLGSIMRTADAAGVHGIIIPKRRAVGLTETVAKASTGAIEYIPVVQVTNLARTMDELKERGLWFFGTDASGSDHYNEVTYDQGSIGLVIGSEGKGMGRLVKEKCDFLLRIPMNGRVTSLNASVAAALLMYEIYRQRERVSDS